MRAFLYNKLTLDPGLQAELGGAQGILTRVVPRRSQDDIMVPRPFLVFGLGTESDENLVDSTANDGEASRQFFQVWVHDEGGSYAKVDDLVKLVKDCLIGASDPASNVLTIRFLETSQEFSNETYNTNFRYIRFQAIIGKATP